MSRMSPRVVLQGQVLNRNTMVREDFVTVCDTKQHFNQEIQRIYTSIKDFPEFTITVAIRQTKN